MQPTPTNHNESTGSPAGINILIHYIMLDNFNTLSSDPKLHRIFHELLLVSYGHEQNLGDILINYSDVLQFPAGSFFCQWPQCQTWEHVTSQTFLQEHTQHPWPLYLSVWECCVLHYLLSLKLAIHVHGETGRHLQEHFNILLICTCLSNATQAGASPPIPFG